MIRVKYRWTIQPGDEEQFIDGSRRYAAGWVGFYWGKPPDELKRSEKIADALLLAWLEYFRSKAETLTKSPRAGSK